MKRGTRLAGVEEDLSGVCGIRQVAAAGRGCTIGVLTSCFQNDDNDDDSNPGTKLHLIQIQGLMA